MLVAAVEADGTGEATDEVAAVIVEVAIAAATFGSVTYPGTDPSRTTIGGVAAGTTPVP